MSNAISGVELSAAARDQLTSLLMGEAVAGDIVDSLESTEVAGIAVHPKVSWKLLAAQPDREAAVHLLEHRFQELMLAGHDRQVMAELAMPEMVRDAADDAGLEVLALRATSALAWRDPKQAWALYVKLRSGRRGDELEAIHEICQQTMALAPAWQGLVSEGVVPEALAHFVELQWISSQAVLDRLITELRADMTTRAVAYLAVFDAMTANYHGLLLYIVSLTERFLPEAPPSLRDLEPEERERLGAILGAIDAPMARGVRFFHIFLPALAVGALLSLGGLDEAALVLVASGGALGGGYAVWAERGVYGRLVRPPLAAYLAEVGTPPNCVVSWLLANRRSVKKIKSFDLTIDADAALAAIARFGRMTRLYLEPAG